MSGLRFSILLLLWLFSTESPRVFTVVVNPKLSCPKGYTQNGKVCVKIEYADFILQCPKGSGLDGSMCVTKEKVPAGHRCPVGYVMKRDETCEKIERFPLRSECDTNYVPVDGVCMQRIRLSPDVTCPRGYRAEGVNCVRVVKKEPTLTCPQGTTQRKNVCERVVTTPPLIKCSTDFRLVGSMCIKEDTAPKIRECGKDYEIKGSMCAREVEVGASEFVCPPGTQKSRKKNVCKQYDIVPGTLVCKGKGFTLEHGKCIRVQETTPEVICEKGYRKFSNGQCERVVEIEGKVICPNDSVPVGKKCISTETVTPQDTCPSGYDHDALRERCVQITKQNADVRCARNFKQKDGQCLLVSQIQPDFLCPEGTVYRENVCENVHVIEAQIQCRRGRYENGICVETSIRPVKVSCPRGFVQENGFCVTHDYVRYESTCQNGFLPRHDMCDIVVSSEPSKVCPKGFSVGLSGKCQKTQATEVKPYCSQGTRLIRGICVTKL